MPGVVVPCGWANHSGSGTTRRHVDWMRYGAVGCGTDATGGPGVLPGPQGRHWLTAVLARAAGPVLATPEAQASRPSADWILAEAETNGRVLGAHAPGSH